jgi:hypothetical protein
LGRQSVFDGNTSTKGGPRTGVKADAHDWRQWVDTTHSQPTNIAAERWAARQHSQTPGHGAHNTPAPSRTPDLKIDRDLELRRDGPKDDLEL